MKRERFLELNLVYLAANGKQQRRLFASPAAYETSLHCFARLFVHFPFPRLEVPLCNLCYYLKQKPPIVKSPFIAATDETERKEIVYLLAYTDPQRIN